jgi:hypothetical protein
MLDTTHHGRRPITWALRGPYVEAFQAAMVQFFERYGLPMDAHLVHGCLYARPKPLGEGRKVWPAPPGPVLWILARLHPGLRRRARIAAEAWAECRWRADVDAWFDDERPEVVARNLELQGVDPGRLDDIGLADHLDELMAHFGVQAIRGMATHGGDLIPVGDYLAHCEAWGVDPAEAGALLRGSSPASVDTARLLAPVRAKVPRSERETFDDLLAEARYGLRMRDDNVGVRWTSWSTRRGWPSGEAGRRPGPSWPTDVPSGRPSWLRARRTTWVNPRPLRLSRPSLPASAERPRR